MNKRKFGIIGEKLAQGFLINKGYEILGANFFSRKGEIDIVARKDNIIVFVEVKTRTNLNYGRPAMAVNYTKRKHLRNAAKIFIHINRLYEYDVRFDVVEVLIEDGKCKINQIEGIMWNNLQKIPLEVIIY